AHSRRDSATSGASGRLRHGQAGDGRTGLRRIRRALRRWPRDSSPGTELHGGYAAGASRRRRDTTLGADHRQRRVRGPFKLATMGAIVHPRPSGRGGKAGCADLARRGATRAARAMESAPDDRPFTPLPATGRRDRAPECDTAADFGDRDSSGTRPRRLRPGECRSKDRKSTRLNSSHVAISYAVFCLKKKKKKK